MPREPWIKVKIGIRRSGKLAALPTDTARLGWFYVLVEAKVQRLLGVFDNKAHFVEVMGRFGKYLDAYRDAGLLHVAPDLCAECKPRHRDAKRGQVIVHDYLREQRDPTNADRQATYREAHGEGEDDDEVTATVTPDVTSAITATVTAEQGATVTPDSRARATTATVTVRERTESGSSNGVYPAPDDQEPTLTKAQLRAWSTFGSEWDEVKAAWLARGFRHPPSGEPDDPTGQRGLLYPILDARPTSLPQWIRLAKGKTAHEVIGHVIARWHEIQAEAGVDQELAAWTPHDEAREVYDEILARTKA